MSSLPSTPSPGSLRGQLTQWLLAPLLLLWAINAWVVYQTAAETANGAHDRTLQGSLLAISERVSVVDKEIVVDLPYSALEMLESHTQSRVYYRVSHADGRNITGYEDLPGPAWAPALGKPLLYNASYRGEPVRVAALIRQLYDESVKETVLVQVAETTELRQDLLRQILLQSVGKELLAILLVAALMWGTVNWGLRQLHRIHIDVSQRERGDLSAIDPAQVPSEVRPLIDAINEHTARIAQMISAQRRFIADAAHSSRRH